MISTFFLYLYLSLTVVYLDSPYLNVVSFELEYVGLLSGQMSMPKRLPEQLFSSVFFFLM